MKFVGSIPTRGMKYLILIVPRSGNRTKHAVELRHLTHDVLRIRNYMYLFYICRVSTVSSDTSTSNDVTVSM